MSQMHVCSPAGLVELMKILAECDTDSAGVWPRVTEDGELVIMINCNDLFYWACADAEFFCEGDVELMRRTAEELRRAGEFGEVYLFELFCCRKRGMRPQYPFFRKRDPATGEYGEDTLETGVRALFDACGEDGSDRNRG